LLSLAQFCHQSKYQFGLGATSVALLK